MTPEPTVYAIAMTTRQGRPAHATHLYLRSVPGVGFGIGNARKFNTPADAESHLRCNDIISRLDPDERRDYLASIPDLFVVLGVLPRALAQAEKQALRGSEAAP